MTQTQDNNIPPHGLLHSLLTMFDGGNTASYTAAPDPVPPKNKAVPVPSDWQDAMQGAYKMYPELSKGQIETTLMMESNMGMNKTNEKTDLGTYGWIGGHIKKGAFNQTLTDFQNNPKLDFKALKGNIPGIKDLSTPQAAIYATASVLAQHQRNNPDMNPSDIYFNKYNAASASNTPDRQQAYNDYALQYAK